MITVALCIRKRLWLFSCGCLAALTLSAAPSFRSDKNYPNLGLRIRTLGGSAPEPLAQHKTYTYTFTRDGESTKRDLYDPRELWYATQHAGQWRDKDDNVLILGRPTRQLPAVSSPVPAGHVSREDFDAALADPAGAFAPEKTDALSAWIQAFAACTPQTPEPLKTSFNLTHALFVPVEESATLVYAFRAKVRKPNGQTEPSDWFVAVIKIADNTPKTKVRKDFETQFLVNVAAVPQTGLNAGSGVQSKALTTAPANGKNPAVEIPDHPSRDAARKSIANMKGWWFAETPEYIFLSDIRSATGKALVKELQTTLPALRGAFALLVPPFEPATDVSVVRIYEEREAYRQYVGKEHEWSIGLWAPMRRELVILSQGKDRDHTLQILRHEGFHQYLFYATSGTENAMWFNEGHACFFEPAEVGAKGRVELPEDNRVNHLLDNLDAAAGLLPKIIRADYSAFYGGSDRQRQLNYTTAWALVYFLRKGVPSQQLTAYEGIIGTYLKTLAATKDGEAATAAAFEGVSLPKLQEDFIDFWKKGRNSGRRYDPLAAKKPAD
ncbi:MAG TPA: DUF1570 domain-containing protein [Kiritimatiellia bacterium]|nr:DUF1570 domain-containing protein [Kiritimatiellia bacterium]HPS09342.1 DUF1570 domain-containing protein [Kiritimatiellia bacterium]